MKLNLNTLLAILASIGVFAPDIAAVASALASFDIPWLGYVVRVLGLLAAFCAAAPLIVPKLRPLLALAGLATPPGEKAPWIPAKDAPTTKDEAVTTPIRPKDAGGIVLGWLLFLAVIWIVVGVVALRSRPAHAAEFGGCNTTRSLCAGPAVALTVGQFNLATSKFSGGVSPGVGYGATLYQDRWYATGVAAYLAFTVGGSSPNAATPSLLLSFANYVRVGVGMAVTEQDVGTLKQFSLLFGVGSDFGGSSRYVRDAQLDAAQIEAARNL